MSISIPSKQVYNVDIPEVEDFRANFFYNYFVPDEQLVDNGKIPKFFSTKSTGEITANYKKIFDTKVPRYVLLSWKKVFATANVALAINSGKKSTFDEINIPKDYIKNNINKIITEDAFSRSNYIGVTFDNVNLYNNIKSMLKSAYESIGKIPKDDPDYQLIANDPSTFNTTYYKSGTQNKELGTTQDIIDIFNTVYLNCKIKSNLLSDILAKQIRDPQNNFSDDMIPILQYANKYKFSKEDSIFDNFEFTPSFNYVKLTSINANGLDYQVDLKTVGYIIDKFSLNADRSLNIHTPIIIESDKINEFIDFQIKYNCTYGYSIRSICAMNVPVINETENKLYLATFLVSSKSSKNLWVTTIENKAPPWPADTRFTWDYTSNKLVISWCMPVNPQYDIKKFQVFRRKAIEHPFQILKEYDFDDSAVIMNDGEQVDKSLVEFSTNPINKYIDVNFDKNSKFIYTLACIDAHGLTSNYGPQFEISFDKFKNELIQKLVSRPGAPKPYPNLYIEGTGFSNTMKVSGKFSKNMRIYLSPQDKDQRYFFVKNGEETKCAFETDMTKGAYKLQIINLDNQKGETLTINVVDNMSKVKNSLREII